MGGVVLVPLTRGMAAIVDAEDAPIVNKYRWYAAKSPSTHNYYAYTSPMRDGKKLHISMSRLIMNAPKDKFVDHRDGNTLDNRKGNLRLATTAQNNRNRQRMNPQNTSGFNGVFWERKVNKWRVQVSIHNKRHHVGVFETLPDAVEAQRRASLEFYGEFSPLRGTLP